MVRSCALSVNPTATIFSRQFLRVSEFLESDVFTIRYPGKSWFFMEWNFNIGSWIISFGRSHTWTFILFCRRLGIMRKAAMKLETPSPAFISTIREKERIRVLHRYYRETLRQEVFPHCSAWGDLFQALPSFSSTFGRASIDGIILIFSSLEPFHIRHNTHAKPRNNSITRNPWRSFIWQMNLRYRRSWGHIKPWGKKLFSRE